ncbi:transcriptional regulator [Flavisolibacter sp. BT320]|nr:transcriptional regulator [Flavisolibacter longurius]
MAIKKNRISDPDAVIGLRDNKKWNVSKATDVKDFLNRRIAQRAPEQTIEIGMLRTLYQMEDYVENSTEERSLNDFVKAFLVVLGINFKTFAERIGMTDGNLKKYLTGERKFTSDLALRFSKFFNTTPDIWLKVDLKNELLELKKQTSKAREYEKFDYKKMVAFQ